jgi:Mrp family chromosome partitioning ATPase
MVSETQLRERIGKLPIPGVDRTIEGLNLIREVRIISGRVDITLASTGLHDMVQVWIKGALRNTVMHYEGITDAQITFMDLKPSDINKIKKIIVIMSGKGGVGKSLVAGLSAVALRRQGFEVGILDADITGPSIPRMFNATKNPTGTSSGIFPVFSRTGIELMSANLLLADESTPIVWRGQMIASMITQFWETIIWGKLDYLIVDLPPGTADAQMTVLQKLPVTGVIIVFSPQELTAMVVRKAVSMAKHANKPILGAVENMSYLYVPEIDRKIEIFGKSKARATARSFGVPLLSQIPIDPSLVRLCDKGKIETYNSNIMEKFGKRLRLVAAKAQQVTSVPVLIGENDADQADNVNGKHS